MAFLLGHKARVLAGEEASPCKRIRAKAHGCEKGEGNCECCHAGWRQGNEGWLALYCEYGALCTQLTMRPSLNPCLLQNHGTSWLFTSLSRPMLLGHVARALCVEGHQHLIIPKLLSFKYSIFNIYMPVVSKLVRSPHTPCPDL